MRRLNQTPSPSGSPSALKPTETTPSHPAREERDNPHFIIIIHNTRDGTEAKGSCTVIPRAAGDRSRRPRAGNNQGPTKRQTDRQKEKERRKNHSRADRQPYLTARWIHANAQISCHPQPIGPGYEATNERRTGNPASFLAMESFFPFLQRHTEEGTTEIAAASGEKCRLALASC